MAGLEGAKKKIYLIAEEKRLQRTSLLPIGRRFMCYHVGDPHTNQHLLCLCDLKISKFSTKLHTLEILLMSQNCSFQ